MHICVCGGKHCQESDGHQIMELFNSLVSEKGLQNEVRVVEARCQGDCEEGPVVRVMPGNTCYNHVTADKARRIVEEHLSTGKAIAELATEGKAKRVIDRRQLHD